jgi:hypothetical protein
MKERRVRKIRGEGGITFIEAVNQFRYKVEIPQSFSQ